MFNLIMLHNPFDNVNHVQNTYMFFDNHAQNTFDIYPLINNENFIQIKPLLFLILVLIIIKY